METSNTSTSTPGAKALLRGTVAALAISSSLAFVAPSSHPLRSTAVAASRGEWEVEREKAVHVLEEVALQPKSHATEG
jgi:hypothetical protein